MYLTQIYAKHISSQTDETALYLIGVVAPPIVQDLVSGSVLSFNEANITFVSLHLIDKPF